MRWDTTKDGLLFESQRHRDHALEALLLQFPEFQAQKERQDTLLRVPTGNIRDVELFISGHEEMLDLTFTDPNRDWSTLFLDTILTLKDEMKGYAPTEKSHLIFFLMIRRPPRVLLGVE